MDRINLSDKDLAANKQGSLSAGQRAQLKKHRWIWRAGTAGILIILGSGAAVFLLKHFNPTFADRGRLFILLPLAVFWLWVLRNNPRQWLRATRDLKENQVAAVTGAVMENLTLGFGIFRTMQYHIQIENYSFRVSRDVFSRMKNGESYRIYFSPHAEIFLGALTLVQEKESPESSETAAPLTLLDPLTERELEVLTLIAAGLSNKEIAAQLSLSTNTVKMYASQLYQKLDVSRRTEAVARAREIGLLEE